MSNLQDTTQNTNLVSFEEILKLVSPEALAIYTRYIDRIKQNVNSKEQARPNSYGLLKLVNMLVVSGLHKKCAGLFYLASPININFPGAVKYEHIRYDVFGSNHLDQYTAFPTVTVQGTKIENQADLYDHRPIEPAKEDLCLVFMMSQPSTYGFDWGGEDEENHAHAFSSAGNASNFDQAIFKWNSGKNFTAVKKSEDTQDPLGLYVIHVNGTSLDYRHRDVKLTKSVPQSYARFCGSLLNYRTIKNPGNGTMKLYATFSNGGIGEQGLTSTEIDKIQQIFAECEPYL